ncbi:MAG: RNA methyltransferase [Lachnospiraceae bacterium]|nr:RNA methyltransferase [Lachnospiraceae bacterium]
MITSTSNSHIKQLVQWQSKARERRRDGVFVAEGLKMLEEAPPRLIREIYLTQELMVSLENGKTDRERTLLNKIKAAGFETVADEVMKRAADTQTPQGVLTVLQQPSYEQEKILSAENGLYLLLEDLQDPGNLGTILRSGEGAGITGVIMTKGTVDIFNPKTIRATMGSVFRVPFLYVESLSDILEEMRRRKIATYAAHLQGKDSYDAFSYSGSTAFLIGNEGNGLKEETAALADFCLRIPMEGRLESLNAAVSASLLVYEAYRQRRKREK